MKPHNRLSETTLLAFLCILCLQARADKRICVLADIHVMAPSLLDRSDNRAWLSDLADNKKMQDLSVPVFDSLVERIKADRPDALLIAGDLTKDGETESHKYVQNKLTEIQAAGIAVYVIPGNHDRWWNEGARKYANNTFTAASYFSDAKFAAAYKDYGYSGNSERHTSTLTYATRLWPGLTLIGTDTKQTAKIEDDAVSWICQKAREAGRNGDQVLLMMHHSLIPHFHGQETFHELSVVKNNEHIRDQFMAAGIKVVLTGHYHVSDIARYTNNAGQEIYDICTGSPIAYPCDYRELTFNDAFTKLRISTKSLTDLKGHEDFPGYAKERLNTAVTNWATKWINQRMGNADIGGIMSQAVANVFVIHAEGNEPANPVSAEHGIIYDDILFLAPLFSQKTAEMMREMSTSMKSILGDYQDPDDTDNVVDDRELTITLPAIPTAIRDITDHQEPATGDWHTLQGIRLTKRPTGPGIYIHNGRLVGQ